MKPDYSSSTLNPVELLFDMEEIDKQNLWCPEEVAPYAKEIFDSINSNKNPYMAQAGYMAN